MVRTVEAIFDKGVFRPLEPDDVGLSDGQRVRLTVEPEQTPEDILALAAQVYEGLSEEEIDEIEKIALDRPDFFDRPESP